jgi:hypothetical protein
MEWKLVALCNALEFFMDGTWKCFNEKIKMSIIRKGAERRWHWEIPSYGIFSSNAAITSE